MTPPSEPPRLPPGWRTPALAVAMLLLVLLPYLPAVQGNWIWDDDQYVTQNTLLHTPAGLARIWTQPTATPQYYPLTHTTFWLEYHLWGLHPLGYHLDNVLLHATSALLLWRLLAHLNIPAPWFAAAIWAIHPLNAESVAWVTERKNVLSGLLYLASALTYLRPILFESEISNSKGSYFLSLFLFLLALLSKTVTSTLPAALLLVIWWKRRRRLTRKDILPLLPFFALALIAGSLTSHLEHTHVGATGPDFHFTPIDRLLISSRAACFYATKLTFPYPLSFIYPKWHLDPTNLPQWVPLTLCLTLLTTLTLLSFRNPQSPLRNVLLATLFFLGTLTPALGFVNIYPMRFSFVADHFQYLAGIGPITLLVAALSRLPRPLAPAVFTAILLTFAGLTASRAATLANPESLWRDTIAKNPAAWMAHTNLAILLMDRAPADWSARDHPRAVADLSEAESHLHTAHDLRPDLPEPLMDLGRVAELRADYPTAIAWMQRAIALDPASAEPHFHLGRILARANDPAAATAEYRRALDLNPRHEPALVNFGALLADQGHPDQSIPLYRRALEVDPDSTFARTNLANALLATGDPRAAAAEYRRVLEADPGFPPAEQGLRRARSTEPPR